MVKEDIEVPKGIKYISEWKDYKLPKGEHCIVDKGVTGCGYTEFCLSNKENVILCSPRKLLLENKRDQHLKDPNILYLENDISDFSDVKSMEDRIREHILFCTFKHLPVKFMVTYDSLHYVAEFLYQSKEIKDFIFVVDEFQSIFLDSYFKSEVEVGFVESLQICPNVIYLSATPMLDEYLEKIPEFKDLKFYKLDWRNTGYVELVSIKRRRVASLGSECGKIIEDYLRGDFYYSINPNGVPVESKEAVFYFNNVADILRVINKYKLTPDNTIIICSDTKENQDKLRKSKFTVGRVPLKDEPNPMFMFCTSAIYMGIDLYSDNARSFVFADPNIDSLALDISLDLPQIVGRQRDRNNPFKNEIVLFYKTKRAGEKNLTEEEFKDLQKKRKESTEVLLSEFSKMSDRGKQEYLEKLKDSIKVSKYSKDFISISKNTNLPVYNYLIDIANERAWKVSQKDYHDQITVTKALEDQGFLSEKYEGPNEKIVSDFLDNHFYKTGIFKEKMKLYCEFRDLHRDNQEVIDSLFFRVPDQRFRRYYEYYGTAKCKSQNYEESKLKAGLKNATLEEKLTLELDLNFKPGDKLALKEIKQRLSEIYSSLGITKTAKAKDLEKRFKVSKTKITNPDGTVDNGFKIIGVL